MKISKVLLLAGALALAGTMAAEAAGFFGFPQAGSVNNTLPPTGNETIPMDTNLTQGLNPATEVMTLNQLSGATSSFSDTWRNKLIGGDFGTNLWQRGTTSASITTAITYTADRWWGLSGTGTAFTVIKQTAAADVPLGASASARVQRTAAQTGVLATCVGQALTTANSIAMQGKTVEFSFFAKAGANFSAANSLVTITISTGTGVDGSAANQSTGSWTGFANAVAQSTTINTSWEQYSAVAAIPSTAQQVGVKICYTPVGTAGANDWFEFANAQLDINSGAVAKSAPAATDFNYSIARFEGRPSPVEATLQQAYYYELDESASIYIVAPCAAIDITHTNCIVQLPTTMRVAPTMTYANGFASPTSTTQATLGACTTLASAATVASTAPSLNQVLVNCTAATIPAAGVASFLYSNGGTGKIKASAEL